MLRGTALSQRSPVISLWSALAASLDWKPLNCKSAQQFSRLLALAVPRRRDGWAEQLLAASSLAETPGRRTTRPSVCLSVRREGRCVSVSVIPLWSAVTVSRSRSTLLLFHLCTAVSPFSALTCQFECFSLPREAAGGLKSSNFKIIWNTV